MLNSRGLSADEVVAKERFRDGEGEIVDRVGERFRVSINTIRGRVYVWVNREDVRLHNLKVLKAGGDVMVVDSKAVMSVQDWVMSLSHKSQGIMSSSIVDGFLSQVKELDILPYSFEKSEVDKIVAVLNEYGSNGFRDKLSRVLKPLVFHYLNR